MQQEHAKLSSRKLYMNQYIVGTYAGNITEYNHGGMENSIDPLKSRFYEPKGLAIDKTYLYISEWNNSVIRKIHLSTGEVSHVAGFIYNGIYPGTTVVRDGYIDGDAETARFHWPNGMTLIKDKEGNAIKILVCDVGNHCIRCIDLNNKNKVCTIAGNTIGGEKAKGYKDGPALQSRFNRPEALIIDNEHSDIVYICDSENHNIRKLDMKTNIVSTFVGGTLGGIQNKGKMNGTGHTARFTHPSAIVIDYNNDIIVSDSYGNTIRRISKDGVVSLVAGCMNDEAWSSQGLIDGIKEQARFHAPAHLTIDPINRRILVVEPLNGCIREINDSYEVHTLAGSLTGIINLNVLQDGIECDNEGFIDGEGSVARFRSPHGIVIDPNTGIIYIADTSNNCIRMIRRKNDLDSDKNVCTTVRPPAATPSTSTPPSRTCKMPSCIIA